MAIININSKMKDIAERMAVRNNIGIGKQIHYSLIFVDIVMNHKKPPEEAHKLALDIANNYPTSR